MRLLPFFLLAFATPAAAAPTCNPELNTPQAPFRIYGDTYYVGTHGVAAILVTSDRGLVLIDGDLAASVPQIANNVRTLGFKLKDVKLILNTHVHCDHAGGIAALQKMSGAAVKASPWSAAVLRAGGVARDDPQNGIEAPIAPVANVSTLHDGEIVRVGPLALTAHFTPGHTPGGTSWTWQSCEGGRCQNMVYADSLSVVSAPGYRFSDGDTAARFRKSIALIDVLPCDILITTHPEVSDWWGRLDKHALVERAACHKLAASAREGLDKRLAREGHEAK